MMMNLLEYNIETTYREVDWEFIAQSKLYKNWVISWWWMWISSLNEEFLDNNRIAAISMAQTRATVKAMRNNFSWICPILWIESTPSEEMVTLNSVLKFFKPWQNKKS